nr:MAG TPA: hypothetical protein [Caudoviricetes sp.]
MAERQYRRIFPGMCRTGRRFPTSRLRWRMAPP